MYFEKYFIFYFLDIMNVCAVNFYTDMVLLQIRCHRSH